MVEIDILVRSREDLLVSSLYQVPHYSHARVLRLFHCYEINSTHEERGAGQSGTIGKVNLSEGRLSSALIDS